MELRHLRYFVAVAEEAHITRAAHRLGIQQPPLSQQIKALEEALNARLFYRKAYGVELTAVGVVFYEDAKRILAETQRAVERAQRTERGEEGRIKVGLTSSSGFHPLVPRAVRLFREAKPNVSIDLTESGSSQLIEALDTNALDAAFVRTSVAGDHGISVLSFTDEPMLIALPSGHRFAGDTAKPLRLETLSGEPFILYRRATGAGLYDAIIAACLSCGFTPRIEQEAPWVGATLNLVAAGLGVSVVPESLCHMQIDGIAFRRIANRLKLSAPIRLAYKQPSRSAAAAAFVALVRKEARAVKLASVQTNRSAV